MSITVIKPGLLDTLQDTGRFGYSHWGINPGGAMDPYAARVADMLVGNEVEEAVIEIHFPGPQLLFEQNTLICLTGADFSPTLNDDEALPLWRPVAVRKNTILHFPAWRQGARCYLAVHGGFCVPKWLNSYGTNLKAAAGGWQGRKLEKGDELLFKENAVYVAGLLKEGRDFRVMGWQADIGKTYEQPNEIGFIKGPEWNSLTEDAQRNFTGHAFTIHPFSDRMGYRLKGPALQQSQPTELISSGVDFGTIQLLPDGELIVLMADHQTTGGYPRMGHVLTSHLPKLAQLRPGEAIRFVPLTMHQAEELLLTRQHEMNILQCACQERLNQLVC